jgi:hypothetical protein
MLGIGCWILGKNLKDKGVRLRAQGKDLKERVQGVKESRGRGEKIKNLMFFLMPPRSLSLT